jgi:hypothetical protein
LSFDVPTGKCIGCTGHEGTKIWKDKRDREEHKEVFLLCDQSYPPILPAHGRQLCIKIIRVENGSIASRLTSEFLNIGRGYTLVAVLPRGRNFGRITQKGPYKNLCGRKSWRPNFPYKCQKRAELF